MKNQKGFISTGVIALVVALLVVGLTGWYLLSESQKVNDEYDAADQANSSLIKPVDSDDQSTNDEVTEDAETETE